MRIKKSAIRNLDLYVHPDLKGQFVRVVAPFDELDKVALERIGLDEPLSEGESYLPPVIGRFSRYNAEGRWLIHRNRPKEHRYIRTVYWTWKQWVGRDQTEDREESRDIFRNCYPRDRIAPAAEEIFGFMIDGRMYAATEATSLPAEADRLKHQVNLMLELFKACEVVRADGTSAFQATTHRRWIFLPSGIVSKDAVSDAISPIISRLSPGDATILKERQEYLLGLDPKEIAQGLGGFSDYLAYVFPQYGRVVLESLRRDNAIYVFKGRWESFSRYTKRQILDENVHDARVLHTKGWQVRLFEVLKKE